MGKTLDLNELLGHIFGDISTGSNPDFKEFLDHVLLVVIGSVDKCGVTDFQKLLEHTVSSSCGLPERERGLIGELATRCKKIVHFNKLAMTRFDNAISGVRVISAIEVLRPERAMAVLEELDLACKGASDFSEEVRAFAHWFADSFLGLVPPDKVADVVAQINRYIVWIEKRVRVCGRYLDDYYMALRSSVS